MNSRRCLKLTGLAVLSALMAGQGTPAWAERGDRGKRLVLESDAFVYDERKQVTVMTGNVVMSKGTLVLKADRVELRQGADGFRRAVAIGGARQVSFRQKRDALDEYIDGRANRLEYEERSDLLRFVDDAVIRVMQGKLLSHEITGDLITYDGASEVYTGSSGKPAAGAKVSPSRRVRLELAPKAGAELVD